MIRKIPNHLHIYLFFKQTNNMEKIINQLNEYLKGTYMSFCFYDETKKDVVFISDDGSRDYVCDNDEEWLKYMKDKLEEYKDRFDW